MNYSTLICVCCAACLAVMAGEVNAQSKRFDAVYTTQVKQRNEKNVEILRDLQASIYKELRNITETQVFSDSMLRKEHAEFRDCLPVYNHRILRYAGIEMRIRLKLKRYHLMDDKNNYLYAENALQALRKECTTPGKRLPSDLIWAKVKYRFERYKAILGKKNGNFYLEAAGQAATDGNTVEASKLMGIYVTGQGTGAGQEGSPRAGDYRGLTGEHNFLLNEWTRYYYQKAFESIEANMEYISQCFIPSADRLEMYNRQMEDCEELYTEIKRAYYLNHIKEMHITEEDISRSMEERFRTKGIE